MCSLCVSTMKVVLNGGLIASANIPPISLKCGIQVDFRLFDAQSSITRNHALDHYWQDLTDAKTYIEETYTDS